MRIIHVSEAFGGGLRSAIINYVQATDDHEHLIFARARAGHETFDVPVSARFVEYRGGLFGFLFEARAFVLQQRADIVHLHSSYAGLLRALLPSGIRIVYSPHCYAMETGRPAMKRAVYWSVERMLAQRPQMLMAVGPREAELGHHLRSAMPIREVPNCATPVSAPDVAPVDDDTVAPSGSKPTIVMVGRVADRAVQIHGGAGVSDDTPLAYFYAWARALRFADGPDEVHIRSVAREEIKRHA